MDYTTFTSEIKLIRSYRRSKKEIETQIDSLWYELSGVKGVNFKKEPSSHNPSLTEIRRLELYDEIEELNRELDFTIEAIKRYERNLNLLPSDIREMVEQIYFKDVPMATVSENAGYSTSGLYNRIRRAVEKI